MTVSEKEIQMYKTIFEPLQVFQFKQVKCN